MEPSDIDGLVKRYRAAIEGHDIETLLSCYAPDIEHVNPSRTLIGRDRLRGHWEDFYRTYSYVQVTVLEQAIGHDVICQELEVTATRIPTESGTPEHTFTMREAEVLKVKDGLIGSVHMYMDRQTLKDMLGPTAAAAEPHLKS